MKDENLFEPLNQIRSLPHFNDVGSWQASLTNESTPESKAEAERAIDAWAKRYLPKKTKRVGAPFKLPPYHTYTLPPKPAVLNDDGRQRWAVMERAWEWCQRRSIEEGEVPETNFTLRAVGESEPQAGFRYRHGGALLFQPPAQTERKPK